MTFEKYGFNPSELSFFFICWNFGYEKMGHATQLAQHYLHHLVALSFSRVGVPPNPRPHLVMWWLMITRRIVWLCRRCVTILSNFYQRIKMLPKPTITCSLGVVDSRGGVYHTESKGQGPDGPIERPYAQQHAGRRAGGGDCRLRGPCCSHFSKKCLCCAALTYFEAMLGLCWPIWGLGWGHVRPSWGYVGAMLPHPGAMLDHVVDDVGASGTPPRWFWVMLLSWDHLHSQILLEKALPSGLRDTRSIFATRFLSTSWILLVGDGTSVEHVGGRGRSPPYLQ